VAPTTARRWNNFAATSPSPALANDRVQTNAAGQVVLKRKTPRRDGTTHLVLSPLEFMPLSIEWRVCGGQIRWFYVCSGSVTTTQPTMATGRSIASSSPSMLERQLAGSLPTLEPADWAPGLGHEPSPTAGSFPAR
jgi:hypothetical protein